MIWCVIWFLFFYSLPYFSYFFWWWSMTESLCTSFTVYTTVDGDLSFLHRKGSLSLSLSNHIYEGKMEIQQKILLSTASSLLCSCLGHWYESESTWQFSYINLYTLYQPSVSQKSEVGDLFPNYSYTLKLGLYYYCTKL